MQKIGIDARMYSDSYTGIGRYTYELIERCIKDTNTEWVLFMNDPEYSAHSFPKHVKKVCVNAKHYSLREQTSFLKILLKEKCDLVHFTHFNVPLLYNRKYIVTIHDTTITYYPGKKMNHGIYKKIYNLVMKHALFGSKHLITVSDNTKKDVVKLFKVNPNKITVIHNGLGKEFKVISKKEQQAVHKKYKLPERFLLYTGVWREHKNIVGMLHAFSRLIQKPEYADIDLVMTGKKDPYYPEVEETIKKLKLEKKVKLVGLVPFTDLLGLYNAASVYVFPSFYEGFGFPPLEAMCTHTPVVASNTSAIPEVCGEAVLYFDPQDRNEITSSLVQVLSDERLQKKLIETGKKQITKFSWGTCADKTIQIYDSVI